MPIHVLEAMAREGFEAIHALHDRRSGLVGFLGMHDTSRGPAFGGMRRLCYRDEREALMDCMRLSHAMARKCALSDLPAGGGKIVLLDRPRLDLRSAYEYVGRVLEDLGGRFYSGPDMGTGERELGWVARRTRFVAGPGSAGPGELAESTAEGVFEGMAAALAHLDGVVDWPARTVVVQGLGGVGERLAERLLGAGARVLGAEIDERRARRVARALGIELLSPADDVRRACDVFAPCAGGGIVHDLSLERLHCRVVAGSANNVLARDAHGERLHERGILYVPDLVVNSGALVRGVIFHLEGRREPVRAIGQRIGRACAQLLRQAAAEGISPARVAAREADALVVRARETRDSELNSVRRDYIPAT